jgi:tetratricopeptide (TPR) repeat protein
MNTVGLTRNRYIVDTEEWRIQDVTEDSPDHELLATALSAYHMEDEAALHAAEQELKRRVDSGQDGYTAIMANQASALLHAGMDHADVAVRFFGQAIEIIEPMPPPRGSANPIKPLYEMYGEVLVDLGRYEDAIEQFETSILLLPNRPRSLLGMARAQAAAGQTDIAAEYYQMLIDIWQGNDGFEGVTEAHAYLAGNPGGS